MPDEGTLVLARSRVALCLARCDQGDQQLHLWDREALAVAFLRLQALWWAVEDLERVEAAVQGDFGALAAMRPGRSGQRLKKSHPLYVPELDDPPEQ